MRSHRKWIKTLGATVGLLIVAASAGDILLPRWLDVDREPLDEDLVQKVYSLLIEPGRVPRRDCRWGFKGAEAGDSRSPQAGAGR